MKSKAGKLLIALFLVAGIVSGYFLIPWLRTRLSRGARLGEWLLHPEAHPDWAMQAKQKCGSAPFAFPTGGYIGFLWGDSFRPGTRHQGIDIFGGEKAGATPVYAAYSGYLTRLPAWKSSVILRIPSDPLQPGRQIWTYYTHMASTAGESFIAADFPPGTSEKRVEAGALLGYQGNYSGDPLNPTGVHLHFSIVLDDGVDAEHPLGSFRNELEISNTLDPSPYFGLQLNATESTGQVTVCKPSD